MASDKNLHSVAALFDTPDQIISALEKIRNDGYKKFDVNSSYPVFGVKNAMGLSDSKIGYVTLIFALIGGISILLFMWWLKASVYPYAIGGKPYFALPAFVPIIFEVSVLFGGIATFVIIIAIFFKLPFHNNPLHDTNYMKNVSCDKYGIVIGAADPLFDQETVTELFKSLGAFSVEPIYYPENETYPIFQPKFIYFLIIVAVVTSGLTYFTLNKLMYYPPYNFMDNQNKGVPEAASTFFYNTREMRTPVKGTVARNYIPYAYAGMDTPKVAYSNPLLPTKNVLELGKRKFLTYCSPCHGNYGNGNSRLMGQFPPGPSLHSAQVIGYSDGKLYHIITNGLNVMPSYAPQITRKERWAIVNYIRVLQRAENPKPSDFTEIKEIKKDSSKYDRN